VIARSSPARNLAVSMQDPELRLRTIEAAGQASVPYTSGLLIGIGETREEIIESLLDLRSLHHQYGHIQVSPLFFYVPLLHREHTGFCSVKTILVHSSVVGVVGIRSVLTSAKRRDSVSCRQVP